MNRSRLLHVTKATFTPINAKHLHSNCFLTFRVTMLLLKTFVTNTSHLNWFSRTLILRTISSHAVILVWMNMCPSGRMLSFHARAWTDRWWCTVHVLHRKKSAFETFRTAESAKPYISLLDIKVINWNQFLLPQGDSTHFKTSSHLVWACRGLSLFAHPLRVFRWLTKAVRNFEATVT